jgi:GxxExxY protein
LEENLVTGHVIDAAMKVHTALGPGLLESAYKACLKHALIQRGIQVESEVILPVSYDGITVDLGYRMDLLVEDTVVVELKAVEKLHPVHKAQLLSYMKLSGKPLGLLINFCELHLKDGIQRLIL